MKKIVLAFSFFILGGCTTNFVKPGATQSDWQRDHNDCLVKANQAGYGEGGFSQNIKRGQFINQCLEGQGWQKQ